MPREVREIPLGDIRLADDLQMREKIDAGVVADYADDIDLIMATTPAVVYFDGEDYFLAGGRHRYHACEKAERKTIRCEVRQGSRFDAFVYALGDNASHGLRRTHGDKRRAILAAIAANKKKNLGWSDRQICDYCGVSHNYITKMRQAESFLPTVGKKDSEGAELPSAGGYPEAEAPRPSAAAAKSKDFAFMKDAEPEQDGGESSAAAVAAAGEGKDCVGEALPPESAESFAVVEKFAEAEKLAKQLRGLVGELAKLPGAELYRRKLTLEHKSGVDRFHCPDLFNATAKLQDHQPYAARCPVCHAKGKSNQQSCNWCNGLPYVTERTYLSAKESVEVRKRAAA